MMNERKRNDVSMRLKYILRCSIVLYLDGILAFGQRICANVRNLSEYELNALCYSTRISFKDSTSSDSYLSKNEHVFETMALTPCNEVSAKRKNSAMLLNGHKFVFGSLSQDTFPRIFVCDKKFCY